MFCVGSLLDGIHCKSTARLHNNIQLLCSWICSEPQPGIQLHTSTAAQPVNCCAVVRLNPGGGPANQLHSSTSINVYIAVVRLLIPE
jgi:hypothetical protein